MIAPVEKEMIVKILGKHYSAKILTHFEKFEIKNKKNQSFSKESIRMIVNGISENIEIEDQILKFVIKTKKVNDKYIQKRQNLLKK